MSDNLPAVVEDRAPVRRSDVDDWIPVLADVGALAARIAGTEFVPRGLRDSVPAVAAAILYGREAGLSPMTALSQTHVIEGKPALSSEAMRGLVLRAGHQIQTLEATGAIVRMRGRRRGDEEWGSEVVWTIDMARAAGLLGKNNWKNYPRQMLTARCSAELCHRDFPDVIFGYRAAEELDGIDEEPTSEQPSTGARVSRAKKTTPAKKALPAGAPLEAPTDRPAAAPGPPLPGEDGFVDIDPPRGSGGTEQPVGGGGSSEGEASDPPPPAGDNAPDNDGDEPGTEGSVGGSSAPEAPAQERRGPRKASAAQLRMIEALLTDLEVDNDRDERHLIAGTIAGRSARISSMKDLTAGDASKVIDTLPKIPNKAALSELLDAMEDAKGDEDA